MIVITVIGIVIGIFLVGVICARLILGKVNHEFK